MYLTHQIFMTFLTCIMLLNSSSSSSLVSHEMFLLYRWAILAAKFPNRNSGRVSVYRTHINDINVDGIEFPAKTTDIDRLEKMNPGLFINAFGYESKSLYPIRVSEQPQAAINLLLFGDGQTQHWVYIKNMSRLVASSTSRRKHFICFRCLSLHLSQDKLDRHLLYCKEHAMARVEMGKPDAQISFSNFHKRLPAPYVIYADCEALISSMDEPTKIGNATEQKNEHLACSVCYIVVRSDGHVTNCYDYRGEDAMYHFLLALEEEEERIRADLTQPAAMNFTDEQQMAFDTATVCWVCENPLGGDRVRDHCHITGDYRGPAHNKCNLMLRICPYRIKIPVVFHNLKGYDSHHIISQMGRTSCDEVTYEEHGKEKVSFLVQLTDVTIICDVFELNWLCS
eukprot:scpid62195/ scgid0665/ 